MKLLSRLPLVVVATLAAISPATLPSSVEAQELASSSPMRWRFGAGYAPMIGLRTEFRGFGNFNSAPALPAPASGVTYNYLNGFVGVDSSGNAGGFTTFFSYDNNAQYDPAAFAGDGALNFIGVAGGNDPGGHISEANVAAAGGFDLFGYLHVGTLDIPLAAGVNRPATWGWRVGAQYARINEKNSDTLSAGMATVTDSYNTGGFPPPPGPYTGPFAGGFGYTLPDSPALRTFGGANALISGSRQLDVHILASQFGTYAEIPLTEKLDLMIEGGAILALAHGSYRYETNVTVPGAGTLASNGYETRTKLLPGLYVGMGLMYHVTDRLGIQAAGRYQYMRSFEINANGSTASLSFQSAFTLSLSAVYTF